MRRDSAYIFVISVLTTVGIVGGAYYLSVVRPIEQADSASPQIMTPSVSSADGNVASSVYSQNKRTDQIIKCVDPKKGEFWTNAKVCDSADLDNRISNAQSFRSIDYMSPDADEIRKDLQASKSRGSSRNPSLRRVAKPVPSGLNVSCKFAVGKALEHERSLSAADVPGDSIWKENYCRWVNETRKEGCDIAGDFFYYGDLCGYGL